MFPGPAAPCRVPVFCVVVVSSASETAAPPVLPAGGATDALKHAEPSVIWLE